MLVKPDHRTHLQFVSSGNGNPFMFAATSGHVDGCVNPGAWWAAAMLQCCEFVPNKLAKGVR